jgi:RND family efflux transporter MFP subunit
MKTGSQRGNATAKAALLLLFVAVVLAGLFGVGILPKLRQREELRTTAQAAESAVPEVLVTKLRRGADSEKVVLPGNIEAIQTAPLFARSNGYLRNTIAKIGDQVKAGQLLAEIEAPETDQEIRQARAAVTLAQATLGQKKAALTQAKANLALAEVTVRRWNELVKQGVFARQAGDEKQAAYDAQRATVEAAQADIEAAEAAIAAQRANLKRLEEVQGYEKITAPFDGFITSRPVDAGALVTAGSASGVREIYRLAQLDTLRIYVGVPQSLVASVKTGQTAQLRVQEYPGRVFTARVAGMAHALDTGTRTQLTELRIENRDRALLPGMYAQVEFVSTTTGAKLLAPATVLVVRADGSYAVAAVGSDNRVHFRKIQVGRDFGAETEVVGGVEGDESLVVNPSDDLTEGAEVRVAAAKK